MLYDTWRRVAQARASAFALCDVATGRSWTFAELRTAAEREDRASGALAHPQGSSASFIFQTLAAWRDGKVLCPLEPGQAFASAPLPPAHCVHLKTTSASTGVARVIAFTAEQLAADAENIMTTMGLRPDWPNLGVISMAHSYGFSNLVLPLLLHGVPLIVAASPLPEALRRAAERWPALTLAGVPALWWAWHEARAIPANVRLAISAGAPLPLAVEQAVFATRALKIHNFYGSSECGGIAYDGTDEPRQDTTCVGRPLHNVALSLNDEGCLRVHSRAVGETYWPETSPVLERGCFQTCDLAELKNGLVFLRGRAGDQIHVAGRKVSPDLIENALKRHPAIRECVVFGVPSGQAERGDIIVACIATTETRDEVLRQFLLAELPAWQVPREWWRLQALAANERGKISRAEWRGRFLEQYRPGIEAAESRRDRRTLV